MRNGLEDTTLAAKVYERVRRGILNGELLPGQPMSRRRIATELRTSPLPVASAFQRLEFEGLLESRPRAGTRVRAVSLEEIQDHFVVWEALETQVAMRVALLATDLELKHLETCARELDELGAHVDLAQYSSLHNEFHRKVIEYCRCDALSEAVEQCHTFAMLWLSHVSRPYGPSTRHQQLVAAISSREPLKAAQETSRHLAFGFARAIEVFAAQIGRTPDSGPIFKRQHRREPLPRSSRQIR
jgi:DNA-binding GntR family transcriptional regulator